MQALIDGWRATWSQPVLPLYFVQLPAFKDEVTGWIRLREEQRRSLGIQYTGMAVTIDLRDSDIHPANKLDVGKRLAYWALAKTYGTAVRVHSSVVTKPRAVRYACRGAPADANLYNQAGLPASPFCSKLELLPWDSGK